MIRLIFYAISSADSRYVHPILTRCWITGATFTFIANSIFFPLQFFSASFSLFCFNCVQRKHDTVQCSNDATRRSLKFIRNRQIVYVARALWTPLTLNRPPQFQLKLSDIPRVKCTLSGGVLFDSLFSLAHQIEYFNWLQRLLAHSFSFIFRR